MTYLECLNRLYVLSDALSLKLPDNLESVVKELRAHYAVGAKRWEAIVKNIDSLDLAYSTKQIFYHKNALDDASISDKRFSQGAYMLLRKVVSGKNIIKSELAKGGEIATDVWLDFVLNNLVSTKG